MLAELRFTKRHFEHILGPHPSITFVFQNGVWCLVVINFIPSIFLPNETVAHSYQFFICYPRHTKAKINIVLQYSLLHLQYLSYNASKRYLRYFSLNSLKKPLVEANIGLFERLILHQCAVLLGQLLFHWPVMLDDTSWLYKQLFVWKWYNLILSPNELDNNAGWEVSGHVWILIWHFCNTHIFLKKLQKQYLETCLLLFSLS